MSRPSRVPAFILAGCCAAALAASCSDRGLTTPPVVRDECPTIGVLPDAPNEFELQWGATNSNASIGHGGISATLSRCGEITSLKWPGPSYHDQLDYLADNSPDARIKPHFGALEGAGAFPGIAYTTDAGPGFSWLRDAEWLHVQRYASDTTDAVITETSNPALGLTVRASTFVLPGQSVVVNHFDVERDARSPVRDAELIFYENFAPTLLRIPFFQIADWALDFQNDYAVVYDAREEALLHFVPAAAQSFPHDFTPLNAVLSRPPESASALQDEVHRIVDGLDGDGVYLAVGAREGDDGHQCGFDVNDLCAYQSVLAERTIEVFDLSDSFAEVARSLFQCSRQVANPNGVLGACRDANGWTYDAPSAFEDAADGSLSGSPIAACQANAALARRLAFGADGKAAATFYIAIGGTRDEAYGLLRAARAPDSSVDAQRASIDAYWSDFLDGARLPRTNDAEILRFARRSLMVLRGATDERSGAIVASVNAQPPYGADWPRDGAFINVALDLAGYPDLVTRHNLFYARVQRKEPGPWSVLYDFGPCDPTMPTYPECIPAGTFEQNYYADPDAVVPALTTSFEIDEASLGVWTWWEHASYIADPLERQSYLAQVCPAIRLGARNLAACRDDATGLQCPANEDDNIPLTQGLQGAETVLLAMRSAVDAAADCGFSGADVEAWRTRAEELESAIDAHFFLPEPVPHYDGGRPSWLIYPVGFLGPNDPVSSTHAQLLSERSIEPVLERSLPVIAYNSEPLVALALLARDRGDEAALAELRRTVRIFIRTLTTRGTGLMSESQGRVSVDLDGDGRIPDYWPQNDVPHAWEHSILYTAAMIAFGGAETPDGQPAPLVRHRDE